MAECEGADVGRFSGERNGEADEIVFALHTHVRLWTWK
jgi:hypothetical protein